MKNIRFRTGIAIVAVIFALAIVLDGFESRDRKANEILSQMQTEIDALNEQERFVDPSEVYRSVIEDNPELVLTKNGGLSKTYNPNIPLSRQEQKDLLAACKEFRISPDIALGLIEKETRSKTSPETPAGARATCRSSAAGGKGSWLRSARAT